MTYTIMSEKDGVSMPVLKSGLSEELAKEFIATMRPGQVLTVWCVED